MSTSAPAPPPKLAPPAYRRKPGRLYLTEPDYWAFQATAERPHEWKSGIGLFDESGEELGEVLPKDGYDEDGEPATPTFRHVKLIREWLVRLDRLLEGSGFEVVTEGLAVRSRLTGRRRYSDVGVLPSPPQFEPDPQGEERVAVNPVALIEILSDSTADEDLTVKLGDYASIPSVTDYLIVAQDEPLVLHYRRPAGAAPADGWRFHRYADPADAVSLAEPPVSLTLAEIYARVFPAE